jgi:FO synthase
MTDRASVAGGTGFAEHASRPTTSQACVASRGGPLSRDAALREAAACTAGAPLPRSTALALAAWLEDDPEPTLAPLLEIAREVAVRGHGNVITVSPNVFIPLTNLCRNKCGYCTFAKAPGTAEVRTIALDEVRSIARAARAAGCLEALFCLGDKPEQSYEGHRAWLAARGYTTTAEYLVDACDVAQEEGLLPHSNAGILSADEMRALRPRNASMGLMLESTSERLLERGGAHYRCPDKDPRVRIRMTREAGELKIPFTSGLLIGIGERPDERVDTLYAIRELADAGGHIQEVIVQSFHPKPRTPMRGRPSPGDTILAGTVALARLILGEAMNLQAPPNLSPRSIELLARSGLNDWGGVSPVTCDFINPEAPWPELLELRARTEASGYRLRPRLAVYPEIATGRPDLFEPAMWERVRVAADAEGYARGTLPWLDDVPAYQEATARRA